MRRLIAALAAVALLASGCGASVPSACPAPNELTPHPRGIIVPGIRVGPLLVTTGTWEGQRVAMLHGWQRADSLTKFLVDDVDRLDAPVRLVGRRCPDGARLRFTQGFWPPATKLSGEELVRRTTESIEIPASPAVDATSTAELIPWGGYLVFMTPGRWIVEAIGPDGVIGRAAIEVVVSR